MSEVIMIRGCRHCVEECITCGVVFTVPEVKRKHAFEEGGYFSCPSGHSQGWDKDGCESARIRRERDRLKQDAARLEQERREAWATASAQLERAQKAEAANKRLKKRASAGTCPCCSRTFANMSEHMKKQHPDFVTAGGAKVVKLKVVSANREVVS